MVRAFCSLLDACVKTIQSSGEHPWNVFFFFCAEDVWDTGEVSTKKLRETEDPPETSSLKADTSEHLGPQHHST